MINEPLREHVTSIGFALTLTKTQIYLLVILHYSKGFKGTCRNGLTASRTYGNRFCVPAMIALERRGLVTRIPCTKNERGYNNLDGDVVLTKAGHLTVQLLKEAGIYQDTLLKAGVDV